MYYDWKDIPDWNESIEARPHELGHFKKPYKEYTNAYSEEWRRWVRDDVTQRTEDQERRNIVQSHAHRIEARRNARYYGGEY